MAKKPVLEALPENHVLISRASIRSFDDESIPLRGAKKVQILFKGRKNIEDIWIISEMDLWKLSEKEGPLILDDYEGCRRVTIYDDYVE